WKHKHLGNNLSLSKTGDFWTGKIRLGTWGDPLNYTVYVRDIAENILTSDTLSLEVKDNDPPALQDDDSYIFATTGDLFQFDISAIDNVEVGSVIANWSHGSLGDNTTLDLIDGSWVGNITLDNGSIAPLQYVIYVEDASSGLYISDITNITVTDNDKPVLLALHHPAAPGTGNIFDIGVRVMDNIGVTSVRMTYKFDQLGQKEAVLLPAMRGEGEVWNTSLDITSDAQAINITFIITDEKGNSLSTDWFPMDVKDDDNPKMVSNEPDGYPTTGDSFDIVAEFSDNNMVTKLNLSYTFDNITVNKTAMERGDGNSWTVTINISSTATGLYYYYEAEDEAGNILSTDSFGLPVRDDDPPIAEGKDVDVDQGNTVTFDASGSHDNIGIASYSWSFTYEGVTQKLDGMSPEFEFQIADEYSVVLTVVDTSGKVGIDEVAVKIWDVKKPQLNAKLGGKEIEEGSRYETTAGLKVRFDATDSTDNIEIVSYTWSFTENGKVKTLQGKVKEHLFYTPGTYTITLTVSDADNNSDTITFDMVVKDAEGEGGGSFGMILVIIIIVVIIATAVIVTLILLKRKGKEGKGKDELDEILSPTGQVPPPIYPAGNENWQQTPATPPAYPTYDQGAPAQGPPGPPAEGQLGPLPPIQ
ncbi:MAG: PKD domain-containing protein, partial [Candidatus Thermoplasmatota archaeon]|nr:PKD domain-containing protein [Candidatus Thermoplasmatota archaeon]